MTHSPEKWLPSITPAEMLGRAILALLVMTPLTFLGLWLNSGSLLSWFATVIVMSTAVFTSGALRPGLREAPASDDSPWITRMLELIADVIAVLGRAPLFQRLDASLALRLVACFAVGVLVGSAEQIVAAALSATSGLPMEVTGLVSLFLVLFPAYVALGWQRQRRPESEWTTEVRAMAAHRLNIDLKRFSPFSRILLGAALRALATVIMRAAAVWLFPLIFSNVFGAAFFFSVGLAIIIAGDVLFELGRSVSAAAKPRPKGSGDESPERTRS